MSKYIVIGDSITKGIVYNSKTNRLEPLKESFINLVNESGKSVINHSVFGATINKGLSLFNRFKKEINAGDYLVLEFGGNDCNFNWKEISDDPESEHLPNTTIENFLLAYKSIIEQAKSLGAKPILLNLPPLHAPAFFKTITRGNCVSTIKDWLGDIYHVYRWQELYSLAVERIAMETDARLIDLRSTLLKRHRLEEVICEDGMHPNKTGHQLFATTFLEAIKND